MPRGRGLFPARWVAVLSSRERASNRIPSWSMKNAGAHLNGKFLDAAEQAGFDVLVTGDKTLEYEQNLANRRIAMVAWSAVNWPIIEHHVGKVVDAVDKCQARNAPPR